MNKGEASRANTGRRPLTTGHFFVLISRAVSGLPSFGRQAFSVRALPGMFRLMRRKLPASLLALVVCASLSPFVRVEAQRRRAPARRAVERASNANRLYDARVAQIGDAYLRGYYAFNPSEATSAGLHEFDSQLEERSAA